MLPLMIVATLVQTSSMPGPAPFFTPSTSIPPTIAAAHDADTIATYDRNPPIVERITIQKYTDPADGNDRLIMRIQYDSTDPMPGDLIVSADEELSVPFSDDGTFPDISAGDWIYSAFIDDSVDGMLALIQDVQTNLNNQTYFNSWSGHLAERVTEIPQFNFDGFNGGEEAELFEALLQPAACDADGLKQNSLFITDLSVVEDPARTYNILTPSVGNPVGAWTFGTLAENMANPASTGVTVKQFLKSWVRQWTVDQTIAGANVPLRENVITFLIGPWLKKAYGNPGLNVTLSNWESLWDAAALTDYALKVNAPFKLTAIVNRIDLRGNSAYGLNPAGSGETRFIFTLVSPFAISGTGIPFPSTAGMPPVTTIQDFGQSAQFGSFVDWRGMNVILEYLNPPLNRCGLKSLGQSWLDLSQYPTFGSSYNSDLQAITDLVTVANSNPARPNRSAIGRIRTNERIFYATGNTGTEWAAADWEFRQFEIDNSSHLLTGAPLFNTPVRKANFPLNLGAGYTQHSTQTDANSLFAWAWAHQAQLASGTHSLPASLTTGQALVDGDLAHFWELNWVTEDVPGYDPFALAPSVQTMKAQMQLSVNTCQGCHAGNTKTKFTHVFPRGYGETADYWSATPDVVQGRLDSRSFQFHQMLSGFTTVAPTFGSSGDYNYPLPAMNDNHQVFPVVSSFLTGRAYSGKFYSASFEDDEPAVSDAASDSTLDGLYYVNDPVNQSTWTIPGPEQRWGFNDLERRKKDLCALVNSSCLPDMPIANGHAALLLAKAVYFRPFMSEAH